MTKDSITVYSLPDCPMCRNLKNRLASNGIDFTDCEDENTMKELGIFNVPVMQVNDQLLDYKASLQWLNNKEDNNN